MDLKWWSCIEEVSYCFQDHATNFQRSQGLKNWRFESNFSKITWPVAAIESLRFSLLGNSCIYSHIVSNMNRSEHSMTSTCCPQFPAYDERVSIGLLTSHSPQKEWKLCHTNDSLTLCVTITSAIMASAMKEIDPCLSWRGIWTTPVSSVSGNHTMDMLCENYRWTLSLYIKWLAVKERFFLLIFAASSNVVYTTV